MAKVLVTGANGFIGSHLVKELERQHHEVIAIPHQSLGDKIGLQQSLQYIQPNYIFHLAAYGNMYHQKEEDEIIKSNIGYTYNLLQATKNIPYKAFIFTSTSSVLLDHQTMYSATKIGAEALVRMFADEYGKKTIIVHPFSVYGAFEANYRFIPTIFRCCYTKETMKINFDATHDWIYIDDVIKVLLYAAKHPEKRILDAGTGKLTRNIQIVRLIEKITKNKIKHTRKDNFRSFDTKKWPMAQKVLPEYISLKKGLEKINEYYKE